MVPYRLNISTSGRGMMFMITSPVPVSMLVNTNWLDDISTVVALYWESVERERIKNTINGADKNRKFLSNDFSFSITICHRHIPMDASIDRWSSMVKLTAWEGETESTPV